MKKTSLRLSVVLTVALATLCPGVPPAVAHTDAGAVAPVPLVLDGHFDNDGLDTSGARDGDFDGARKAFQAEALPASGVVDLDGVPFRFPSAAAGAKNNVVARGQTITLPAGRYHSAYFLVSASTAAGFGGSASGAATVRYSDGTTSAQPLTATDWIGGGGILKVPFYSPDTEPNVLDPVSMYTSRIWLDPARTAVGVTLPATDPVAAGSTSLHVFAASLQPVTSGRSLDLRGVRSTTKRMPGTGDQAVEATVVNTGNQWITAQDRLVVSVTANGVRTTTAATVGRLAPGEETRVRVGIRGTSAVKAGTRVSAAVTATSVRVTTRRTTTLTVGVPDYVATDASLGKHESPYWFDDAKFGLFVMYGPYSLPAWAPAGELWAEWYWALMTDVPDPRTKDHHKATYGEDFTYDDFIKDFSAERFDAAEWVRLFEQSGAKYYVFSAKQHDGYAMWDSKVSGRDSVDLGPKRDFVKELFDASRTYAPGLRNGLYFSMQEWYNPDLPWLGHGPINSFTGESVPYTGYQSGRDYIADYQVPQMKELYTQYPDLDLLWCDILGPGDSRQVQAGFFNADKNKAKPRDVAVNDVCSVPTNDFTTTANVRYSNTVAKKWEASQTIEPISYGFNQTTPLSSYKSTDQVVDQLVDVVSKNGNLLLTLSPQGDGTFPSFLAQRMRDVGAWLKTNGEAVYGTTYWSRMSGQGSLRFTVKPDAFYVISTESLGSQVVVDAPVPIRAGDKVTLLGYDGGPLSWSQQNGKLTIQIPAAASAVGKHAWSLKISQ
ncbi:alpha-L-fucosidase [Micromonospora sp. DT201]|uniref:alpha-L-fucosidase n=1 Tax=Micromonospora sp. DT201 TaxID=3393442 RepID=UPI003CF1C4E9